MKEQKDLSIFAKYVSLNIVSMIGLSCYILADTYYVANGLGENGLAALNIAIPVFSFINGIGMMLGVGGATKFAIYMAQDKKDHANNIFIHMIYGYVFFVIIMVFTGIFLPGKISFLLGADYETIEMTKVYIRIILLFSPAFVLNNIINSFVKNDGSPHIAMAAMLSGSIFNIIFDYVFIFIFNMGMTGAAIATGTAPLIGLLILSVHFIKKKNNFRFKKTSLNFNIYKSTLPLGVPSLVTELSSGIVIIVFNILILKITGNTGVAAYGIIANISLVIISIFTGIAQGIQPVLSNAYGKRTYKRIKNVFKYSIIVVISISLITYLILLLKTDLIVGLFNRDNSEELNIIAESGIKIYFMGIPFVGFNIVMCSYFASVEKKIPAQVISFARGLVLIIPMVIIFSIKAGITGIWLSFPFTEFITTVLGIGFYFKNKKYEKNFGG